jgi:hypothetical protein
MFTASQLQYMAEVQAIDDWACSYFPLAVAEYWYSGCVQQIPDTEFAQLQEILARATAEDLWNLQRGLDYFNLLSVSMFKFTENA